MAVRYRGTGLSPSQVTELGKVFIDAADSTPDFLASKLVVTANLILTTLNPGGNEQLQLDVNTGAGGLGGVFVKRSPSGENQTIQPLTDNVPLTLRGFAGGLSDLLDLKSSGGTIVASIGSTGTLTLVPSADVTPLTVQAGAGVPLSDIVDITNHAGLSTYVKVDNSGLVTIFTNLIVAPTSALIPFKVTGNSTALDIVDINTPTALVFEILGHGNVIIKPDNDAIPLTLKGSGAGTADLLDLVTPGSVTVFKTGGSGATIIAVSTDVIPLTLQQATGGVADILDLKSSGGTLVGKVTANQVEIGPGTGGPGVLFISPPGSDVSIGVSSGGYGFRKNSTTLRGAMRYAVSPEVITLGDSAAAFVIAGTFVSNADIPWRDFKLDNDTNVTTAQAGVVRRNDTNFCIQASISDNTNTQRFKSLDQLWETGAQGADGVNSSFTITFTNAQKDAKYFVVLEPIALADAPILQNITKTNTGFTISFNIVPNAFDGWTWFAVRYGT